jgi:hypothetical protein
MTDETYNGFTNKPTWIFNVYFGDDGETIEQLCEESSGDVDKLAVALEGTLESYFTEYIDNDSGGDGMMDELLGWAVAHIDWRDLAETYMLDYEPENAA